MTAAIALTRVIPEHDPLWQAAMRAPLDDGPIPEEERLAVEEAANGTWVDGGIVTAQVAALLPR